MTDKTTPDPRSLDHKPEQQGEQAKPETPVSDKQTPRVGSGEHGRPTDDSDPGHS